jgi:hypothetical protein
MRRQRKNAGGGYDTTPYPVPSITAGIRLESRNVKQRLKTTPLPVKKSTPTASRLTLVLAFFSKTPPPLHRGSREQHACACKEQ